MCVRVYVVLQAFTVAQETTWDQHVDFKLPNFSDMVFRDLHETGA